MVAGISVDRAGHIKVQPAAVVEWDRRPLLYVVNAQSLVRGTSPDATLDVLRTKLACRGEPAWLAISRPGELTLYALGVGLALPGPEVIRPDQPRASALLQDLASGQYPGDATSATATAFHDLLFRLVTETCRTLLQTRALSGDVDNVLSLVGRALFARFLIDRGLLNARTGPDLGVPFEQCFASAKSSKLICEWLDRTFNGDLLPLADKRYRHFFTGLGGDADTVFGCLTNVLYRAPDGQLPIAETWSAIDFAHVPVGLLSEVYEQFAHEHGPLLDASAPRSRKLARVESIHYTPHRIAKFMVEEALAGIPMDKPHEARVLDPAAGGGVFLTLAYRELVAMRWRAHGRRPGRKQLRSILNQQIRGFDINVSALKLAALGLYLTALELDANPTDPEGLAFEPLLGNVLYLARGPGESHPNPHILGSLGPAIGPEHNSQYDVVIGNPPWTSWQRPPKNDDGELAWTDLNPLAEALVTRIAASRLTAATAADHPTLAAVATSYTNADRVPDVPFVWRAMAWARPGGVIAFALHGRLLFKQSAGGAHARKALFSALRVTGLVNGASLRQENVWPNTDAPWCLLFAVNAVPLPRQSFYYVNPVLETRTNAAGIMRVDFASSEPIEFGRLAEDPALLKYLYRGTGADADVVLHVRRLDATPLKEYWGQLGLHGGEGYQRGAGTAIHAWMRDMPHLTPQTRLPFRVTPAALPLFGKQPVARCRKPEIYRAPLVLWPAAVRENRDYGGALLVDANLLYSESFTGYSTAGYSGPGTALGLAQYLHVLGYSKLFTYWALMTSAQFGVERDALQKEDIDAFPVVTFAQLAPDVRDDLARVSRSIVAGKRPWRAVDELVSQIYHLSRSDQQTIDDTLAVSAPFSGAQLRAQAAPSALEMQNFIASLARFLKPLLSHLGKAIEVRAGEARSEAWRFIEVVSTPVTASSWATQWIEQLADDEGASRVVVRVRAGYLGIAMRAQYRYWTRTRARLCGLDILRQHSDFLVSDEDAE